MKFFWSIAFILFSLFFSKEQNAIELKGNEHISLVGNNLCSRMLNFGYFESNIYASYPNKDLLIRNLCDGGNTPAFQPHASRPSHWAFEEAKQFSSVYQGESHGVGHFPSQDEWLSELKTDIIIAFYGFSESFNGPEGVLEFEKELQVFIDHTFAQKYNGHSTPKLVLVSPIAYQNLSDKYDVPNGEKENKNLQLYSKAIEKIALKNKVLFIDAFSESLRWYKENREFTIDGMQLNDLGYRYFSAFLTQKIFNTNPKNQTTNKLRDLVLDKNWYWHNDYKIPNGVHAYGRRYDPFGPENYPFEIKKIKELTAVRDTAIWSFLKDIPYNVEEADKKTSQLPAVKTNFVKGESQKYLYGQEALNSLAMAPGFKIELFASEEQFPNLANPSQISFDNQGRLWVAVMPTYPHYRAGDPKPNDKILIYEDTDGDNKADREIVFADKLHIPAGFEITEEGVYVSQGTNLILLKDIDGDSKADQKEIVLSGFDDHDTHHVISAFCADPSGAIYMGEGVFLHSNVETPYGTIRATNGGFMRYTPQKKKLERTAQIPIPNPWGIAFDNWGQPFYLETSSQVFSWMYPATIKSAYGISSPKSKNLVQAEHRVRPTSGLEFVSSRHFPDHLQGSYMLCNTIGFLGIKVHSIEDDGTGYKSSHLLDLVKSSDPNFRPVDLEFAPDGSLYLADWYNVLIGHMQHNARDPLRDHVHGRIYRITYPEKPLIKPAIIVDASIPELFDNLKKSEYRSKYRTRRELRKRDKQKVASYIPIWTNSLDKTSENYENLLLEALWVSWGINRVDTTVLQKVLNAKDYKIRTAGVNVIRYNTDKVPNYQDLLLKAAKDTNSRVRFSAAITSSWLDNDFCKTILDEVESRPVDDWMEQTLEAIHLQTLGENKPTVEVSENIGKLIYEKEGHCATCHQLDGKGLPEAGFPPIYKSEWVSGSKERLIKITLDGLIGPLTLNGKKYPGQVPMTPFKKILSDNEIAEVLNYIRTSFGNSASSISAKEVAAIRKKTQNRNTFYTVKDLE